MNVGERYRAMLESGRLEADPAQAALVERLSTLSDALVRRQHSHRPDRSLFARWFRPRTNDVQGVRGLYLWGGVGRGKSLLADLFFDSLPFDDRRRLHFHRFMAAIHADLRALGEVDDPLERIADDWASRARLLLLDEIHVNDITDAMLLGGLLTALFARGVTLVTTSNAPPDELYRNGLQRARFLPAIAQLRKHCDIVPIASGEDYRQRVLAGATLWVVASREERRRELDALYGLLASGAPVEGETLEIGGRELIASATDGGLLRVESDTLLSQPRSTGDYIALAERYHTVMVDDIPQLDRHRDDEARRFVNLVDEFYDHGTRLVASAAATPDALYTGERLAFEFERAASRLVEMQGADWRREGRDERGRARASR